MIGLPSNNQWKTALATDLFGSLVETKNLSLDKNGYVELANKVMCLYNQDQRVSNDFGVPQAIINDSQFGYIFTTTDTFAIDLTSPLFTVTHVPTGGATPTFYAGTDAVFFQGIAHGSGTTTVGTYSGGNSGSWTSVITGLTSTNPHPLCVMENRQTLLVGEGNVLQQYSAGYALDTANTLTIPSEYIITWVRYRQSTAVIGTRNIKGGEAKVFLWNGTGVGFQTAYGVGSDWAYSGCEYASSIAVITSAGRLLRFNGAGFDELASLPVWGTPYPWSSDASNVNLIGKVASRGMQAHGNSIYLNIEGTLSVTSVENPGKYLSGQQGGLWVYDPEAGIYHKGGYTYDFRLTLTPSGLNSGYITFATPHQAQTGDAVIYSAVGAFTNLNLGQTYYAIVEGTTSLRLALSPADAFAGRVLAVSGTPTTDKFTFDTYTSTGSSVSMRSGPVLTLGYPHVNTFFGTEALFAGSTMAGDGTEKYVLCSLGMGRNRGSFVTPKIQASQVTDTLQKLYAKFNELSLDTDQMIVKYRNSDRFGLPTPYSFGSNGNVWTSSTTLTIDTTKTDFKSAQVGDEIEILEGAGAGYLAHITAIDTTSSTYIVTIDEALPVTNGQICNFTVNNWTKYQTLTNQSEKNSEGFGEIAVGSPSTWFQFKIELRGRDISLYTLEFINAPFKQSS